MHDVRLLTESDLRACVQLDLDVVDCIESAFVMLAKGKVVMPPVLSMAIEQFNGEVDVKTAYVEGIDSFAIKISPGFFDNPAQGLPSTNGLMALFSARTGMLEALLLDNGYLTDVRTAAAGAVAARHMAPVDAQTACIIGAGVQAELQLKALCLVRRIASATVWARHLDRAEALVERLQGTLDIAISATADRQSAVSEADVIVTTTPSSNPLIDANWLRKGQHITAMGSDQYHKNELTPACLARADRYVPDRYDQAAMLGELHHALDAGMIDGSERLAELGDIAAGNRPGRKSASEITICDLTGTGVQDTAIATLARERAESRGIGTWFPGVRAAGASEE